MVVYENVILSYERSIAPMKKRRKWFGNRKKASPQEAERAALEASLAETRRAINYAYAGFNTAADPQLVESFVYEIRALQTRYSYLIRRRKALERPHSTAVLPVV